MAETRVRRHASAMALLLALGLAGAWGAARPAATPLLATVRLPLDPRSEVDTALDVV